MVKYPEKLCKIWKCSPVFGVNCCIDKLGKIRNGDKVKVLRNKYYPKFGGKITC